MAVANGRCRGWCLSRTGIRRTQEHPSLEQGDFNGRQRVIGRHEAAGIMAQDRADEGAFSKILRHHGGSVIAAFFPPAAGVEDEPAIILALRLRMAFETPMLENREDLGAEKPRWFIRDRHRVARRGIREANQGREPQPASIHSVKIPRFSNRAARILRKERRPLPDPRQIHNEARKPRAA